MLKNIYRLEPRGKNVVSSLVVLLHGYGANGQDLLNLGKQWQSLLPNTAFISPDAPEPCAMNPHGGFQWFDLTMQDQTEYWRGVQKAAPVANAFLDQQLKHYGLKESAMALVGFSQGAMMVLHLGYRRKISPAAVVSYSGLLAGPEHLAKEMTVKPPTLLVHGSADNVVPPQSLGEAEAVLKKLSVPVTAHMSRGLGHGIDPAGLQLAAKLLQSKLPKSS